MTRYRARTILPLVVALLGCALRVRAYHANYSLTIDEAAIARNLIDHSWVGLVGPIDYAQLVPLAFLFVEKSAGSAFGYGSDALRLFPLVCGMLSIWLCWAVSRRIMSFTPALASLALFALANPFVDYSVRIKPYSADVAVTLLIVLLALALRSRSTRSPRRAMWLGVAGAATVLVSFTAAFVLAAAAIVGFVFALKEQDPDVRRDHVLASAFWAAGAGLGVYLGWLVTTPNDLAYMKWFWSDGFVPFPLVGSASALWLWSRLLGIFGQTGQYRASAVWLSLAVVGLWSFQRRRRGDVSLLLSVPLVLTLIASGLRLYPFAFGRVDLFLLPLFLILVAEGAGYCLRTFGGPYLWVGAAPMLLILVLACSSALAGSREGVGRSSVLVMEYLRDHRRPGDRVYVLYDLGRVFEYYAPRYGISARDYDVGGCHRGSARGYLQEVDALRDRARVWILMSSDTPESRLLLKYLDEVGTRVDEFAPEGMRSVAGSGAFMYLYDLRSASSRDVSAANFPVPDDLNHDEPYAWSCYGVFQSPRR